MLKKRLKKKGLLFEMGGKKRHVVFRGGRKKKRKLPHGRGGKFKEKLF